MQENAKENGEAGRPARAHSLSIEHQKLRENHQENNQLFMSSISECNLSSGFLSGDMANPQNVELEAAKFLQKLIQESKDEPSKLATKLYEILQHMRSGGKENSMPYQVISRAMEIFIKEHSLDIESLMSPRLPLASGAQIGDSTSQQLAVSSQRVGASMESNSGNEIGTPEAYASTRAPTGPGSGGQDTYQGSVAHITGKTKS